MSTATNVKRDYYEVLGVVRTSSEQEIKTAYRKMAMQHHPDRNPDDPHAEEKFKECSEAYSVLADPQKRAAYDRYGHAGVGSWRWRGVDFNSVIFQDFSDVFSDLFGFGDLFGGGRGRGRSRAQRGADLREDIDLDFEEAVFGVTREVEVRKHEAASNVMAQTHQGIGQTCRTCGARTDSLSARILQHRAHLDRPRRLRAGGHRSLPDVPRRRARAQDEEA